MGPEPILTVVGFTFQKPKKYIAEIILMAAVLLCNIFCYFLTFHVVSPARLSVHQRQVLHREFCMKYALCKYWSLLILWTSDESFFSLLYSIVDLSSYLWDVFMEWLSCLLLISASILYLISFSERKAIPNLTVCLYGEKLHGCQLLLKIGNYLSTTEEDPDRKYWVTLTGEKQKKDFPSLKSRRKISPLSVRYKFSHWENNKWSHLSVLVSVFPLFFHPEMVSCLQAFLHPWLPSVSFHSWSWSIWWMWLCLAFCTEGVVERYCTIISITQCPSVCQSYFYNL